jgi:hypothetical protein
MRKGYGIIFVSAVIAMATFLILPCLAQEKKEKEKEKQEKDIWTEEEPRGPRGPGEIGGPRGPGEISGPGEPRGPGGPGEPRGPRWGPPRWFELTDETIGQIMKDLAKSEPAKAAELSKLREKDLEKFKEELGKTATAREYFEKVIRERMEAGRRQMQAEYIEWLEKNYPKEAEKLAAIKERDPNLYIKQFRLSMDKYGPIFRVRENPELCEVLKEDLELREKADQLVKKIKSAGKEDEKKELTAQLEKTVGRRFDLLVRQKEIEYGRLLKRLEELKKQLEENKAEVTKWKDAKFRDENVRKRVDDLIKGPPKFKWD